MEIIKQVEIDGQASVANDIGIKNQSSLSNFLKLLSNLPDKSVVLPMLYYVEDSYLGISKIGMSVRVQHRINSIRIKNCADEFLYPTVIKTWSFDDIKQVARIEKYIKKAHLDKLIDNHEEVFEGNLGVEYIDAIVELFKDSSWLF